MEKTGDHALARPPTLATIPPPSLTPAGATSARDTPMGAALIAPGIAEDIPRSREISGEEVISVRNEVMH
jgi:hypothetical protein